MKYYVMDGWARMHVKTYHMGYTFILTLFEKSRLVEPFQEIFQCEKRFRLSFSFLKSDIG